MLLRRDGLLVSTLYGETGQVDLGSSGVTAASICQGFGAAGGAHGSLPDCVVGDDGRIYYPEYARYPDLGLPEGVRTVVAVDSGADPWTFTPFVCGLGVPGDACPGKPDTLDVTGLDEAVSTGNLLSGAFMIGVATATQVGVWPLDSPPVWYDIEARQLVAQAGVNVVDTQGRLWILGDAEFGAELVAVDVVAVGEYSFYQTKDGYVWGLSAYPGNVLTRGPKLPVLADRLVGQVENGCAIAEGDVWCWSSDGSWPLGDLGTPL